jgi:hypothetical protein
MRRLKARGAGEAAGNGWRREGVGGAADPGWRLGKGLTAGPHLSATGAKIKGRGRRAGPARLRSWANLGRPARAVKKKKKACWPGMVAG